MTQTTFIPTTPSHQKKPLTFRQWQLREGDPLYRLGASALSSRDLIAHIVRSPEVADNLLEEFGSISKICDASICELKSVPSVTVAIAETLSVTLELARRNEQELHGDKVTLSDPHSVWSAVKNKFIPEQESLLLITLNTKNQIKSIHEVFRGSLNASIIHPREIFKIAVRESAASIIIAHNHPTGDCEPSKEDINATMQIVQAGQLLQIPVLDHIIVGPFSYLSMRSEGHM